MLIEIPVNELLPTVEVLTTAAGDVAGVRIFFLPGDDRQSISLLTATEDDRERLKAILERARHMLDYRPLEPEKRDCDDARVEDLRKRISKVVINLRHSRTHEPKYCCPEDEPFYERQLIQSLVEELSALPQLSSSEPNDDADSLHFAICQAVALMNQGDLGNYPFDARD